MTHAEILLVLALILSFGALLVAWILIRAGDPTDFGYDEYQGDDHAGR